LAGSPGAARLRALDDRRVADLQAIRGEIETVCLGDARWRRPEERELLRPLPATLEELGELAQARRPAIRDPESGEEYGYEVIDRSRYRLCATFLEARDEDLDPLWNHAAGRQCWEFDVLLP
jgi:hypothetical protein